MPELRDSEGGQGMMLAGLLGAMAVAAFVCTGHELVKVRRRKQRGADPYEDTMC
jgi:hypothetical protein